MSVKSLSVQVGGDHYKKYVYQPLEFAEKAQLTPIIFCAFKYVCRYKDKNKPVEDLQKALHCIDVFEECGVEKLSLYNIDYLTKFLQQFDDKQRDILYSILRLQGSKVLVNEVRSKIKNLLMEIENDKSSS